MVIVQSIICVKEGVMKKMKYAFLFLFVMSIIGCGIYQPLRKSSTKLSYLKIGMTKNEVQQNIGNPDEVRGSVTNVDGDIVTVWEYAFYSKGSSAANLGIGIFSGTLSWWVPIVGKNFYWLYFVEEDLAQWGRAGDWQPDIIKEIRIR